MKRTLKKRKKSAGRTEETTHVALGIREGIVGVREMTNGTASEYSKSYSTNADEYQQTWMVTFIGTLRYSVTENMKLFSKGLLNTKNIQTQTFLAMWKILLYSNNLKSGSF